MKQPNFHVSIKTVFWWVRSPNGPLGEQAIYFMCVIRAALKSKDDVAFVSQKDLIVHG